MKTSVFAYGAAATLVATSAATAGNVIFDQIGNRDDLSDLNGGANSSQIFEAAFSAYNIAALDDFNVGAGGAKITLIEGVVTGFNGYSTLAGVNSFNVEIYSSTAAAAASLTGDVFSANFGGPSASVNFAGFFSFDGPDANDADIVSFDVNINLGAGTYYVAIVPQVDFGATGQSAIATSSLNWAGTNPGSGQANPNGGFGFPFNFQASTQNLAYRISAVPAPGALLLLGLAGVCGTRRRRS
jgi:hypothetical protein